MATPNPNNAVSIKQHAELAAKTAAQHQAERYSTVMKNPAAAGRFDLAMTLLSVTGDAAMSAAEIITALEKAPLPAAPEPPAPTSSAPMSEREAAMQIAGFTPQQVQWERDYARGAAAARYLLGKE